MKKFIADQKINYQIVMGDDRIAEAFGGVEAIPTTFIIDRQGTIRYRKVGAMPAGEFEAVVTPFLEVAAIRIRASVRRRPSPVDAEERGQTGRVPAITPNAGPSCVFSWSGVSRTSMLPRALRTGRLCNLLIIHPSIACANARAAPNTGHF